MEKTQPHRNTPQTSRKSARRRAVGLWVGGTGLILMAWVLAVHSSVAAGNLPGWWGLPVLSAWFWIADGWMRRPGGVPCLTWHSVSAKPDWLPWAEEISVRPETLDRQLSELRRMGCHAMDTREFVRRRRACQPVPRGTVLLHFDDGYLDNWVAAAPILQRHGMIATLFVSLEFTAPERPFLPTLAQVSCPPRWDGYLSWGEIAALDRPGPDKVFDVQPHGVNHGRLPSGPRNIGRLNRQNWKFHAWVQWGATRGSKHDWYLSEAPPAVPVGTEIPQSEAALAAPAYVAGRFESSSTYAARVSAELARCRAEFKMRLNKDAEIFCWPQNRTSELARQIATKSGYLATTAGTGVNAASESSSVISRVHIGENVAGFSWPMLDIWHFHATVRCFQGNAYWYLLILVAGISKRLHKRLFRTPQPERRRKAARTA